MSITATNIDQKISKLAFIAPVVWVLLYAAQDIFRLRDDFLIAQSSESIFLPVFILIYGFHFITHKQIQRKSEDRQAVVSRFRLYSYALSITIFTVIVCGFLASLAFGEYILGPSVPNVVYGMMMVIVFGSLQLFIINLASLLLVHLANWRFVRALIYLVATPLLLLPIIQFNAFVLLVGSISHNT